MDPEKRTVKTKKGLKEYTYLGCPLTRNRSPWCFRLCVPDPEGHGECGRVAPHSFKSHIQLGIEAHSKKVFEEHRSKLERMYLASPALQADDPGVRVTEGEAELVIPMLESFLDPSRSVDASVCFRAMEDASRLAANSVVRDLLLTPAAFSIELAEHSEPDSLVARAHILTVSDESYLTAAVLVDSQGQEIARANGAFVQTKVRLSAVVGYN